jgi:hypothetical protein
MPDPYPIFEILPINGNECIGDSRPKINTNFNNLSASANFACMRVAELSTKWAGSTSYSPNVDSGYIVLASGLVFQWGRVSGLATDGSFNVTFPYQGMTAVLNITTSHVLAALNAGSTSSACSIRSDYNTVGFTLLQDTVGTNAVREMWMAIGAQ